jgi:hypothetical protein
MTSREPGELHVGRTGYALTNLIVAATLVAVCGYVAAGWGVPGGSIYRRMTGTEAITGGLTSAMRSLLQGRISEGLSKHRSAGWLGLYLIVQVVWRITAVVGNLKAYPIWIYDLAISLILFAATIYLPSWW